MVIPLRYNLRSLMQRKVRTLLTALGIFLVVFVAVLMTALSRGIVRSMESAASPDNVMVLSKGAETIEFSAVDRNVLGIIENANYVAKANGGQQASPELFLSTFIRATGESAGTQHLGIVRGTREVALRVHEQVRLTAGRWPRRGYEVLVGRLAATKLDVAADDLALGRTIHFEGHEWTVVGQYEAKGTVLESEIWTDIDDLMVASKRDEFSCITLKCGTARALEDAIFDLSTRTDVLVDARPEADYYRAYAQTFKPVQIMTLAMTVMLVLGGVIAGMNTMFTAISGRVREIGTLRVLGFKRRAIMLSFLLESTLIAVIGGIAAIGLGTLLNGLPIKIPMGAFRFQVDITTVGLGLGLSVLIGVLGSAIPVVRSGRLKTVEAIRAV